VATLGVILSAAYMLWLVQRLFYGPQSQMAGATTANDLRFGEQAILWPFAVLMLVMGMAPSLWITAIESRTGPVQVRLSAQTPGIALATRTAEGGQR